MAPEYEKAAKKLEVFKDQVLIAKVNCDVEKDLARRFNIGGYPTLLWYPKGSKNHESYNSGRDAQSILNWVEKDWIEGAIQKCTRYQRLYKGGV